MKQTRTTTTIITTTSPKQTTAPKRGLRLVKRVRTITVRTQIPKQVVRRSTAAVTPRSRNAITMLPEAALPAPTVKVIRIPASSVRVRPGR